MSADAALRFRLKAATEAAHLALHGAPPFAAIADARAGLVEYRDTLQTLYRYHAAMAPLCAQAAVALALPQAADAQQARLDRLAADIASLGGAVPDETPALAARDTDFAAGVLYVVLGSVLGGKVIHRQLDYLLPGAGGRRFFGGGTQDGALWRDFCRVLDLHGGEFARLCEGAVWAFAQFAAAFDAPAQVPHWTAAPSRP